MTSYMLVASLIGLIMLLSYLYARDGRFNQTIKRYLILLLLPVLLLTAGCSADQENNAQNTNNNQVKEEVIDPDDQTETPETQNDKQNNEQAEQETKNKTQAQLGQLKVHYIDVGQSDATLLEATNQAGEVSRILIDAGDWNQTDALDYLRRVGVDSLDLMVGTHPHADHIGQMNKIIKAMPVSEVWMSGVEASSAVFQRTIEAIIDHEINYVEPRAGENIQVGDLDVTVLHPKTLSNDANDSSVSMRIVYGDVSFIFTGDAETKGEQAMIRSGLTLKADILHLGHHGSDTSTIPEFFSRVNPDVAIYSAGNNSYGHPSETVVKRVKDAGVDLYGTNVHGTIVVTTDGQTYDVKTDQTGTVTAPKANETTQSSKSSGTTASEPSQSSQSSASLSGYVNINTASSSELQQIIHIGPTRAEDVIDGRPYDSVDDLIRVNGIAEGRLADIIDEGKACVK